MAFSSSARGGNAAPMGDINVTPLVDVMLVLLIIFMLNAPLASFEIPVDLPQPTKNPIDPPPDPPLPIRLRIDGGGQLYWDNSPLPKSALRPSLLVEATRDPQPTLEIETSPDANYEVLADVLATAKNAKMIKIGFVETM